MARMTMISGLQRTRLTTSRGHSVVMVSGRVATVTDERERTAPAAGRSSAMRRQAVRQE